MLPLSVFYKKIPVSNAVSFENQFLEQLLYLEINLSRRDNNF